LPSHQEFEPLNRGKSRKIQGFNTSPIKVKLSFAPFGIGLSYVLRIFPVAMLTSGKVIVPEEGG